MSKYEQREKGGRRSTLAFLYISNGYLLLPKCHLLLLRVYVPDSVLIWTQEQQTFSIAPSPFLNKDNGTLPNVRFLRQFNLTHAGITLPNSVRMDMGQHEDGFKIQAFTGRALLTRDNNIVGLKYYRRYYNVTESDINGTEEDDLQAELSEAGEGD